MKEREKEEERDHDANISVGHVVCTVSHSRAQLSPGQYRTIQYGITRVCIALLIPCTEPCETTEGGFGWRRDMTRTTVKHKRTFEWPHLVVSPLFSPSMAPSLVSFDYLITRSAYSMVASTKENSQGPSPLQSHFIDLPNSLFPGQVRAKEEAARSHLEPRRPAECKSCLSPLSGRGLAAGE